MSGEAAELRPGVDARPLIVTLKLDAASFARLDGLRRTHFPAAINRLSAHLTLFHHLPGERLAPAEGDATVCGTFVETDDATGLAKRISPIRVGGRLAEAMPAVES